MAFDLYINGAFIVIQESSLDVLRLPRVSTTYYRETSTSFVFENKGIVVTNGSGAFEFSDLSNVYENNVVITKPADADAFSLYLDGKLSVEVLETRPMGALTTIHGDNSDSVVSTTYTTIDLMTFTLLHAGEYELKFNSQIILPATFTSSTFDTATAKTDQASIYATLIAMTITDSTHSATFGSETITAGIYYVTAAIAVTGTLTLNGEGDANAIFVIRSGAAISSSASATMVLTNGASAANIYFVADGGTISLGANSIIYGNLISNGYAVSSGANCGVTGRLLTSAGAVSFDGVLILPTIPSYNVNFGSVSRLILFSGNGAVSNTGTSTYTGDIATDLGAITGFGTATVNGTIFPVGSTTVITETNPNVTFAFFKNEGVIDNSQRIYRNHLEEDLTVDLLCHVEDCIIGDVVTVKCKIDLGTVTTGNRTFHLTKF